MVHGPIPSDRLRPADHFIYEDDSQDSHCIAKNCVYRAATSIGPVFQTSATVRLQGLERCQRQQGSALHRAGTLHAGSTTVHLIVSSL